MPNPAELGSLIERVAERDGVSLAAETVAPLAAYCDLILRHGARTNLVGTLEAERLIAELVLDSVRLAPLVDHDLGLVVDVGSGAGIPVVPLLLVMPGWRGVALEPRERRAAFLTTVRRAVLPGRLSVSRARLEGGEIVVCDDGSLLEESFDLAVSRALFEPAEWLSRGACLVRRGGSVGLWWSGSAADVDRLAAGRPARAVEYGGPRGTRRAVACVSIL